MTHSSFWQLNHSIDLFVGFSLKIENLISGRALIRAEGLKNFQKKLEGGGAFFRDIRVSNVVLDTPKFMKLLELNEKRALDKLGIQIVTWFNVLLN